MVWKRISAALGVVAFLSLAQNAWGQQAAQPPHAAQTPTANLPADLSKELQALGPMLQGLTIVVEDGRPVVVASLKDILHLVMTRNIALDSVRLGKTIAQSALEVARNRLHPMLTNSLSHGRNVSASNYPDNDFLTLAGADATTLSSSYSKKTETGIQYGLTYSEVRSRYQGIAIANEGDKPSTGSYSDWTDSSSLKGAVDIPIGQDFGTEYNNIPVKLSEVGVTQSKLTIRQKELDLINAVASTYWNLVGAQETVDVQKDAVKLSEQLLADNRVRLEAGVLSPTDVQVTQTQLARDRQTLLSDRLNVLRIEDQVRALLNLEQVDFGLRPKDRPELREQTYNFQALIGQVFENNTPLQQIKAGLESNALNLETARNKDKTNLDLQLYYTFNGYSSSPLKGISGFSQPQTDAYGAMLTWTVPLFDRTTPETIRQRMLERQQLDLQEQSLKSDLSVQLQSTLRQIRLAKQEVDTARVTMNLANQQLQNQIDRFRLGQSTSFQVAQSQQEAAAARVQEILARVRYESNYLNLLVLTGQVYSHYGLTSAAE